MSSDVLAEIAGVKPKTFLADGEDTEVSSMSSNLKYKVKRTWDHYYCVCPAWRNQGGIPVDARTCKHLRELFGDEYEAARLKWKHPTGPGLPGSKKPASKARPASKGKPPSKAKAKSGKRQRDADDEDDDEREEDEDEDEDEKPKKKKARKIKKESSDDESEDQEEKPKKKGKKKKRADSSDEEAESSEEEKPKKKRGKKRKVRSSDGESSEDEKPRKKKAAKGRKRRAPETESESEEEVKPKQKKTSKKRKHETSSDEDSESEDEKPKSRGKAKAVKKRKGRDDSDDESEDSEDAPKKTKTKTAERTALKRGIKKGKHADSDDEDESASEAEKPKKKAAKSVSKPMSKGLGRAANDGDEDTKPKSKSKKPVSKPAVKVDDDSDDAAQVKGVPELLLANKWDIETGPDPTGWWVSEKLDGVRTFYNGKGMVSRLGNPFTPPQWFLDKLPKDLTLDGELFGGRGKFQDTVSIVKTMNSPHWKEITFQIFDIPSDNGVFEDRVAHLKTLFGPGGKWECAEVIVVEQEKLKNRKDVLDKLKEIETLGGEGLMLRKPGSKYEGRRSSTLLKVKTFYDAEAEITDYKPGSGKHTGVTGALKCKMASGKTFHVGSGLSDKLRKDPPKIGTIIVYRFQELTRDGVPRFPTYVGEAIDKKKAKDAVLPAHRKINSKDND